MEICSDKVSHLVCAYQSWNAVKLNVLFIARFHIHCYSAVLTFL